MKQSNQNPADSHNALENKVPFSAVINSPKYQKSIISTLQDMAKVKSFCATLVTTVTNNPSLQDCTPKSVISSALKGETLNLSFSPELGQCFLVPFENKKAQEINAVLVVGYKGLIQLALRSGKYKKINVFEIKEGELKSWNPITEVFDIEIIEDEEVREKLPTKGYIATFELQGGFTKTIYWSYSKMLKHADRYSPAFSKDAVETPKFQKVSYADYLAKKYPKNDEWKYSSFWYKNFDEMAFKTMLRQLITKWGIISVDLQKAFENDTEIDTHEDSVAANECEPNNEHPNFDYDVDVNTGEVSKGKTISLDDLE